MSGRTELAHLLLCKHAVILFLKSVEKIMKNTLLAFLVLSLFGCSEEAEDSSPQGLVEIPGGFGKGDNYIATNAKEFLIRGSAATALPSGYAELEPEERDTRLSELVSSRTGDITRAAQRRIDEIIRASNQDITEENKKFFIYVKPSYQGGVAKDYVVEGEVVLWDFHLELVGSLDLLGAISASEGGLSLTLEVSQLGEDFKSVEVVIEESPSTDSFPAYNELFADGVFDIAIHFGGDYNAGRYDLETAKWTVEFLLERNWTHPSVQTFEDLKYDSGPFVMPLFVEGREVEARVYVYHAQMDDDAGMEQSLLRELVEESFRERDVVIYSGHAGANSGFLLDYHPRYEFDDDDFKHAEMRSAYQIYVFDGCNSYRTYVDKLMENPVRTFANTDAVTTVNTTPFSAGYEIINRFVHWFTFTDQTGRHFPISWNTMLQGVNDEFPDVHYGVHGVDQGPKLNPHSGDGPQCMPCRSNEDCGSGGNYCVNYRGGGACSVGCTTSEACGSGFECISLFDDPELFYIPKQCVATGSTCG